MSNVLKELQRMLPMMWITNHFRMYNNHHLTEGILLSSLQDVRSRVLENFLEKK